MFARILGDAWLHASESVRRLHSPSMTGARGRFRVAHGHHRLARLLARVLGLPGPGLAVAVQLTVAADAGGERWRRVFDGHRVDTRQSQSNQDLLAEQFGVFEFRFDLRVSDRGGILYRHRDAALRIGALRWGLPRSWSPRIEAVEEPAGENRVAVSVRGTLPGIGVLIAYDGVVEVEETDA